MKSRSDLASVCLLGFVFFSIPAWAGVDFSQCDKGTLANVLKSHIAGSRIVGDLRIDAFDSEIRSPMTFMSDPAGSTRTHVLFTVSPSGENQYSLSYNGEYQFNCDLLTYNDNDQQVDFIPKTCEIYYFQRSGQHELAKLSLGDAESLGLVKAGVKDSDEEYILINGCSKSSR